MTKGQLFVAALVPAFIAGCQAAPATTAAKSPSPAQTFQVWSEEPGSRLASSTHGVADSDIAELPDGRFRMYYLGPPLVDGQPVILSAISSDGLQWTPEPGVRCQLSVCLGGQPGVVAVPSGGWRLFFNHQLAPRSSAGSTEGFTSAVTTDGLTFTADPGVRLLGSSYSVMSNMEITGAKVVAAKEGGWRLYFSERFHGIPEPGPRPRIFSAHSTDLINWTPDPGVRASAAIRPKVFRLHDGSYRLFAVCTAQPTGPLGCGSIMTATSADGLSWSDLESTGLLGGDPSGYVMRDGQIRLYYNDGDFYASTSNDRVFSARLVTAPWGLRISRQPAVAGGTMIERVRITVIVIGSGPPDEVSAVDATRSEPRQVTGLPQTATPPFQLTFEMQPPPQVQLDELIKVSDGNVTSFFDVLGDPAFEVPNCGLATSTPCPPINCGAGFSTPCSSMPCGSADQLPCSVVRNAPLCETGQPVGRYGCFVTSYSGFQEYCPPKANVDLGSVPNACAPYYKNSP